MGLELSKVYEPSAIENAIFSKWTEQNVFYASPDFNKKPYCIVIPPPNITGSLHMGHALDNTIQDAVIRFKRMQGFDALWIPGTDHAGIATQMVVEKDLAREGTSRHKLGREKFLERVWQWKEQYGSKIVGQLKRMGCSCDWTRERFTMDAQCSRAVKEAFVRLFDKGYIYRGNYIINWCVKCRTAISDLEVEHKETASHLYYLRYPVFEGDQSIIIATTRPETILADVAIAVNPNDDRYKKFIGKYVILPLVGRRLPIILDEGVDIDFGTGALKITPGHDHVDFEIGIRHNLEKIVAITPEGKMNDEAGKPYAGMDRFACRKTIVEDLRKEGYLVKITDYKHSIGHCSRCGSVIEPQISWQWFLKVEQLAKPALKAVKDGKTKFYPERFKKIYINWMDNIKDWCISRQLWWGHRIPVWKCEDCNEYKAYIEEPQNCSKCGGNRLSQEEDVLDTWFSSALWPFSVMGWPEKTKDLSYFFPTSILITARDIIFLWVARMIMFSIEFMGEVPFKDVFIHATILNKEGKRMSKSLGTGVDPLDLFDRFGTDAVRFGLIADTIQGQDVRFSEERMASSRNFANKIWNASRFILSYFPEGFKGRENWNELELSLFDKWILSRFTETIKTVTQSFDNYKFYDATKALYEFFWDDFCDWYIEIVKPSLQNAQNLNDKILNVLFYIITNFLKLLHPLMPFITEELWQYFEGGSSMLVVSGWPLANERLKDIESEDTVDLLRELIKNIRNLRAELNLNPKQKANILLKIDDEKNFELIKSQLEIIKYLANIEDVKFILEEDEKISKAITCRVKNVEVFLPFEGNVDIDTELIRLKKEIEKVETEYQKVSAKLHDIVFLQKAPAEIIEKEKERLEEYKKRNEKILERRKLLLGSC